MNKNVQYNINNFDIRLAKESDLIDVYNLSNDFVVRNNSFNSDNISLNSHTKWFYKKITSTDCLFFVIRDTKGVLVAQIRFDLANKNSKDYIVTIHLNSLYRGKGLGTSLLKLVSDKLIKEFGAKKIIAYVKLENIASKKVF